MKFLKKLNGKSQGEQLFIMLFLLMAEVGFLCLTGCFGRKSCETPSYNSSEYEGIHATSCSIPGCGGCLSPGRGCNSACWPQSCIIVHSSADENVKELDAFSLTGCDIRYYDGGCLGCAQSEKSCYSGCVEVKSDDTNLNGFFYGSSDSNEKIIGCGNGCGGCVSFGGSGREMMNTTEDLAELGDMNLLRQLFEVADDPSETGQSEEDSRENEVSEGDDNEPKKEHETETPTQPEESVEWNKPQEGVVMDCNRYGRINTHGEVVCGYKSSYVVEGGKKAARVRKSLGNGWHIVSQSYCYSKGIWWYELYDSQDGDYYGWVDSAFIDFDDE